MESAQSSDELSPIRVAKTQKAVGNVHGEIEAGIVEHGLRAVIELERVMKIVAMRTVATDKAVAAGDYAGIGNAGHPACVGFGCVELEQLGDARACRIGSAGCGGGVWRV